MPSIVEILSILVPKQAHTAPSRQRRRNCSVPGIKLYIPYYRPFYLWRSKPILYLQAMVFCPAKLILSSWLGGLWNEKHVISWEPSTMGGGCLEEHREKPSKEDLVKGKVRSEKGMFKWKQFSAWGWAILLISIQLFSWGILLISPGKKKVILLKIHWHQLCFSWQHLEKAWGRSDILEWNVPALVNMAHFL